MAFETINMNLTAMQEIESFEFNISGTSVFGNIVDTSNSLTEGYLIMATMLIIMIVMYLTLSDKTPLQDFGYDDLRALNIALSSCVLIGLTMVSIGWSNNFKAVGLFATAWFLTWIIILSYENKE